MNGQTVLPNEQKNRRAYWTQQMEAASRFMDAICRYPVEECGETLASLPIAVDDAGIEVEFSTSTIFGALERIFFVRSGLIPAFIACAREMNQRGWVMRVEDGFRTTQMQKQGACNPAIFDAILERAIWENEGRVPSPEFVSSRVAALVAGAPKVGPHVSGSAIDISVLRRDDRAEIDRGGLYLEMSELTPMTSPFISRQALENRLEITRLMDRHGFATYPYEFWHYNCGDAATEYLRNSGQPARYGPVHFNPEQGSVMPIDNPTEPLNSTEEIRVRIEQALARMQST